jgi:hypothetical protein
MKERTLFAGILLLIVMTSFSGCFNVDVPSELLRFSITSFTVEPSIINSGETANLSWIVIAATTVSIDHGIGTVSLIGNRIITPTNTTTYTLTARNTTATVTATVQVIVRTTQETLINETGEIQYIDLEGGFYGIIADNGNHYDPANLSAEFKVDGLRIRFTAQIAENQGGIHMWGTLIEILEIEKIE